MKRFSMGRVLAGMLLLLVGKTASGQSFNLDVDISAGGEVVGQGVPSSFFGAAADQPGFWNRLGAAAHTQSIPLLGLNGQTTSATVRWNMSGGGRGSGYTGNSGDYRLLLNDGTLITVPVTYQFEGFAPGSYRITSYALSNAGWDRPAEVIVPGATIERRVSGAGEMPGNGFVEGITHCFHELQLTGSNFEIIVTTLRADRLYTSLTGFQMEKMAVPEPIGGIVFFAALVLFGVRRRKA